MRSKADICDLEMKTIFDSRLNGMFRTLWTLEWFLGLFVPKSVGLGFRTWFWNCLDPFLERRSIIVERLFLVLLGIFFGLFVNPFFIYWMFMTFAIVEKKVPTVSFGCCLWSSSSSCVFLS